MVKMALISFDQMLLALVGLIVSLAGFLLIRHKRRKAESETNQPS